MLDGLDKRGTCIGTDTDTGPDMGIDMGIDIDTCICADAGTGTCCDDDKDELRESDTCVSPASGEDVPSNSESVRSLRIGETGAT